VYVFGVHDATEAGLPLESRMVLRYNVLMLSRLLSFGFALVISLGTAPAPAAATLSVSGLGYGGLTVQDLIRNVTATFVGTAYAVCVCVFIIGAFFLIISTEDEQRKGLGKSMMIGAVIGAIIIAGAQGIMNTTLYFLYS